MYRGSDCGRVSANCLMRSLSFPSWLRWIVTHAVLIALQMLQDEDLEQILNRAGDLKNTSPEDDSWSLISEQELEGLAATSPCTPASEKTTRTRSSNSSSAQKHCHHTRTTRKGSNYFQSRIRCKDCGMLLLVELTEAGRRCKFTGKNRKQG